jgi:hypothetical protein
VDFPEPGAPASPMNTRASPSPSPKNAAAAARAVSSLITPSMSSLAGVQGVATPGSAAAVT